MAVHTPSVQTVFGIPFIPGRFLPLVFALGAVLVGRPDTTDLTGLAAAGAAGVLSVVGGRWPLTVVVCQSIVLVLVADRDQAGPYAVGLLAAFAVVELLMRRDGYARVVGVVVFGGALAYTATRLTDYVATAAFWTVAGLGAAVALGVHLRSVRVLMARYHDKYREAERLRESATLAARATERAAIARELHDLVAHHVASIVLRVGVARHVAVTADPRLATVLDDVHTTGTAALGDLRELVGVLRDPATVDDSRPLLDPADLPGALAGVAERITGAGLPVRADVDPGVGDLDGVRRLAVLRIAQEGLTNALKHATRPTGARLTVRLTAANAVTVEISDDGAAPATPTGGHGLVGLRERVELIGGTFHAGPDAPGWRLRAVLPPVAGKDPS